MKVNLQTRTCNCGYEFVTRNIKPPLNRVPKGFYGGNVDRICPGIACPECGAAYDLWIKQTGQTWKVVTLASEEPVEVEVVSDGMTDNTEAIQAAIDAVVDVFDSMEKPELQEWLSSREVKFHTQAGEKKLRDLCRKVAAEPAEIVEVVE